MNICPTRAIETNYLYALLLTWSTQVPLGAWAVATSGIPALFVNVLQIGYSFAVLLLTYWIFWQTCRNRGLASFQARLSPTRYYRRYLEPQTTLAGLRENANRELRLRRAPRRAAHEAGRVVVPRVPE